MAKVQLTPEQQSARTAYKAMWRAFMVLVTELGDGGLDEEPSNPSVAKLLTQTMDALEKKYGKVS